MALSNPVTGTSWQRLAPLWLGLVAAGYFALSCRLSLEWFDEGVVVYPSWRVAQGAVPYREFQQLYGPSVFFLNGLLFRLFGVDLFVIRVGLVVLKAITAVLVYLAARRVASAPYALAVYGLMLCVWGAPWWVFNTPYANHYAMSVSLAGLLLFLSRGGWRGAAMAGFCFGIATTFKQTAGIFAFVAFVAFVSWEASASDMPTHLPSPPRMIDRYARLIRVGAVLGALAIVTASLAARNTVWNALVLFAPLSLSVLWVAWRDARSGVRSASPGVQQLIAASLGMALPLIAYGLYYARLGLLGPLVFNAFVGLPQAVHWLEPVPTPDERAMLLTVVLCAGLAAVRLAMSARAGDWRRQAAWVALGVAAVAGCAFLVAIVRWGGVLKYVREDIWIGDVFRIVFISPWLILAASFVSTLLVHRNSAPATSSEWSVQRAAALFHFFAAANLLVLYPAGDFPHVVMMLPAVLPTLAFQLERFCRVAPAPSPDGWRARAAQIAVAAVLCVCAAPFVYALVTTRLGRPADAETFPNASGIVDATAKYRNGRTLVRYLDGLPRDAGLVVIGEGQMLNFLAARVSPLEQHEYVVYLLVGAWMDAAEARALAPEADLIARLEATKPIVVISKEGPFLERFQSAFGAVVDYIDRHYQTVETIGPYRVLTWRAT